MIDTKPFAIRIEQRHNDAESQRIDDAYKYEDGEFFILHWAFITMRTGIKVLKTKKVLKNLRTFLNVIYLITPLAAPDL